MLHFIPTTTKTRLYTTEHVEIKNAYGNTLGVGKYKWSNRPWQRFTFSSALSNALKDAGFEGYEEIVSEAISFWSCIEELNKKYGGEK